MHFEYGVRLFRGVEGFFGCMWWSAMCLLVSPKKDLGMEDDLHKQQQCADEDDQSMKILCAKAREYSGAGNIVISFGCQYV